MEQLLIFLVIAIVLFLVVRFFWLWYWKVDERVGLLKDIRDAMQQLSLDAAESNDHLQAISTSLRQTLTTSTTVAAPPSA